MVGASAIHGRTVLLPVRRDLFDVTMATDYDERVLPSIVNEVTKAVVAKYNASELLTKREVGSEEESESERHRYEEKNMDMDMDVTNQMSG